jgi:hypothetical protein
VHFKGEAEGAPSSAGLPARGVEASKDVPRQLPDAPSLGHETIVTITSSSAVAREIGAAAHEGAPTTMAVALVAKPHHLDERPLHPRRPRKLVLFVVAGVVALALAGVLIRLSG